MFSTDFSYILDEIVKLLGKGTSGKVVEVRRLHPKAGGATPSSPSPPPSADINNGGEKHFAVKITRRTTTYRRAAKKEIAILRRLKERDPADSKYLIRLLDDFDYNRHICMVFDVLGASIYDLMVSEE